MELLNSERMSANAVASLAQCSSEGDGAPTHCSSTVMFSIYLIKTQDRRCREALEGHSMPGAQHGTDHAGAWEHDW